MTLFVLCGIMLLDKTKPNKHGFALRCLPYKNIIAQNKTKHNKQITQKEDDDFVIYFFYLNLINPCLRNAVDYIVN